MPKKLDKSGRIYLTALDREAAGVEPGDVLQVAIKKIKKSGDTSPANHVPRSEVPA